MRTLALILSLVAGCDEAVRCPVNTERNLQMTAEATTVVEAHNASSLDLYARLAQAPGNRFFSPISVSAALSMVYAGARGATAEQLRSWMGIAVDDPLHHETFGGLLQDLSRVDPCLGTDVAMANGLFGQAGTGFEPGYIADIDGWYDAPLTEVDFGADGRQQVNDWVSEQTGGAIDELLGPDDLGPNPILVVANAIRFSGRWKSGFDPDRTEDAPFRLADGTTVQVPTMHADRAMIRVGVDETAVVAELPYQGGEIAMLLIQPMDTATLPDVEASLAADLDTWVSILAPEAESPLSLPRFDFDDTAALHDVLPELGVSDLFDPVAADLSGITGSAWVEVLKHQATIAVDEVGTEATAATAASANTKSTVLGATFDRPFVFLLRDRVTGAVLFVGRLDDPRPS